MKKQKRVSAGGKRWSGTIRPCSKPPIKLAASINEYGTTGQTFYQNVLKKRQTDKEMKVVAGGIVQNMEKLEASIAEIMDKGQASTNLMLLTFIISGVVVGVVLAVVITRSIVVPIQRIIDDLNEGAEQVASASTQVSAALAVAGRRGHRAGSRSGRDFLQPRGDVFDDQAECR